MYGVTIIGVGRMGGGLALSLPVDRYRVDQVVYRHALSERLLSRLARQIARTSIQSLDSIRSEIVIIATQDTEVEGVARMIEPRLEGAPVVLHTSGSLPSSVLDILAKKASIGSIHPLVSISDPLNAGERFAGAYFCIEGMSRAVEVARQIARDLSGKPFAIDTEFKTLYHAAAVTACGHLVALLDVAIEMMSKCGLTSDQARHILMPLISSTVRNLEEQGPVNALTGTFARADLYTFTQHLQALNENASEELLEIYLLLGERSLELASQQGINTERIEQLRSRVAIAKSKLKW